MEKYYNITPIDQPGIKVIIDKKTTQIKSVAPQGEMGWYVGPNPNNYRFWTL